MKSFRLQLQIGSMVVALGLGGCVATQPKETNDQSTDRRAEKATTRQNRTSQNQSKPSAPGLPANLATTLTVRPECAKSNTSKSISMLRRMPMGFQLTYAAGDCDNYGNPTGLALISSKKERKSEHTEIEGVFVDGAPVKNSQYTLRSIGDNGFFVCTNLWYKQIDSQYQLKAENDTVCTFEMHVTKKLLSQKDKSYNLVTHISGVMGGNVDVFHNHVKFSGATGKISIKNPQYGSLLGSFTDRTDDSHGLVRSEISRSLTPKQIDFEGKIERDHWSGNVEFDTAGEKFSAKNVVLSGWLHDGGIIFCGDTLTIENTSGNRLNIEMSKCAITGFRTPDGGRLEQGGAPERSTQEFRAKAKSAAFISHSNNSTDFRFGNLALVPLWGKVTWPDGRVFDGAFQNGKPFGQ